MKFLILILLCVILSSCDNITCYPKFWVKDKAAGGACSGEW